MRAPIRAALPPDPEEMNDRRAQWAFDALDHFSIHGEQPEPEATDDEWRTQMEQNLSDLIADFGHFCDRAGLRMQSVLRTAIHHYQEETDYAGEQFSLRITLARQ